MADETRARGANGRFRRTLKGAERDAEACRLLAAGKSYREIAAELAYGNPGNAHRAIEKVLAETLQPAAEHLRTLELQRLDMLWAEAWAVLQRDHVVVNSGKIVTDTRAEDYKVSEEGDESGSPLLDDAPKLKAIETLRKLAERRAALLGLDAPTKIEQTGTVKYVIEGVNMEALR